MRTGKAARWLALALLAFALHGGRGPARATSEPARVAAAGLWHKALDVYRRNENWYPQRVAILSEILNRRGEPTSVTELFFSLRMEDGGRIRAELARALKNGEDTTAKMREKVRIRDPQEGADPDEEESYSVSLSDSPFDPERQEAVTYTASPERLSLFGHSCRRFDFSYRTTIVRKGKREEMTWNGMAWLEEGSGMPVKLEFTLAPLPSRIRSLWTVYLYETARPDKWVVSKVKMFGHGGFLFIKKYFRSTTTFSDYRLPPAREAQQ